MGVFRHRIEIAVSPQGPFEVLEAVVDSGSSYTWIPADVLAGLGVQPVGVRPFITADNRIIEREIAEVLARLEGQTRTTICVFGDTGSEPLLGAYTLEGFGLAVDTVNRRLVSVPGYLLEMGVRS